MFKNYGTYYVHGRIATTYTNRELTQSPIRSNIVNRVYTILKFYNVSNDTTRHWHTQAYSRNIIVCVSVCTSVISASVIWSAIDTW